VGRGGFLFMVPAFLFFLMWVFFPVGYGIWLSLTNTNFLGPSQFVGANNFKALLHDPTFIHSVYITAEYAVATVAPTLLIAFWVARALSKVRRGSGLYLTILLMPFVVPLVATSIIFELLLQPAGLVDQWIHASIPWLSSEHWSLIALCIATTWSLTGYYVVILLASIRSIPEELREAARLDGATDMRVTVHVELPLLRPAILFCTVTSLAAVLTNFATPYIMTSGGPADATLVLPLLIYQTAFEFSQAGYAAAMAVVVFVISGLLTVGQFILLRPRSS